MDYWWADKGSNGPQVAVADRSGEVAESSSSNHDPFAWWPYALFWLALIALLLVVFWCMHKRRRFHSTLGKTRTTISPPTTTHTYHQRETKQPRDKKKKQPQLEKQKEKETEKRDKTNPKSDSKTGEETQQQKATPTTTTTTGTSSKA
jgi:hypothetical protein